MLYQKWFLLKISKSQKYFIIMIIIDGIIFKIGWCKLNFTRRNEKTGKRLARAKLAYACRILPHPSMFLANFPRAPLLNFRPLAISLF